MRDRTTAAVINMGYSLCDCRASYRRLPSEAPAHTFFPINTVMLSYRRYQYYKCRKMMFGKFTSCYPNAERDCKSIRYN